MAGLVIWAGREAQVKMTVNMVQEGPQAIADTIVEKRMKAQGPGHPWGKTKTNQTPAVACNIEEWMQGIEKDDSMVEVRNGREENHRAKIKNAWSWNIRRGRRPHRWQGKPQFPWDASGGSPFSGGGSSDWGSDQGYHQSKGSREGNRPVWEGRGLRVKVNLLIFKDEKTKDAVTSCSWQLDVAIFHHSGWDDQHLLPYVFRSLQGFLGNLARSLGKDTTLTNVLQMLDEHYGTVMTFHALSKELYSLKQTSGENVAEFGVCLSQQVQILQLEYPGRIQQEQVEEMEWDHFYKGLNPEFRCMLAHKVDGDHPTSYSDLLLATQKLKKQNKARDPLLPKTTTTGRLNVSHSQTPVNLFPSGKLKGNQTFTAQLATMEGNKVGEDSDAKPEWEEEVESSLEEPEASSSLCGADQPISYIVCFANAVEQYQKKTWNYFGCGSPNHLIRDFPKDVAKLPGKQV